jgi:hypothetical protein
MSETHVISALVAKRAELTGMMLDLDRRKAALKSQVRHIDHSLAIFGYRDAPRDIRPVVQKVYRFERRELPRLMRQFALTGVENRDVALAIIVHKGWDASDRDLVAKVADSVKSAKNYVSRKARAVQL